jgi:hypothetical protein
MSPRRGLGFVVNDVASLPEVALWVARVLVAQCLRLLIQNGAPLLKWETKECATLQQCR